MTAFEVRRGRPEDARGLAELFAAVAEERDGIATEPPVDVDARTTQFAASIDGTIVAVAAGDLGVRCTSKRTGSASVSSG